MTDKILKEMEEKMKKIVESIGRELGMIRTGRAQTAILDGIRVEYYGTPTPLKQVAAISTPDARTIIIQPWEKNLLEPIEKTILKSDLSLTPANDGRVIRIPIPSLTEERRKDLVKLVKNHAEEGRIVLRSTRREGIEEAKKLEKEGKISEDDRRRTEKRIQELTDSYISKADSLLSAKEKEIMEV